MTPSLEGWPTKAKEAPSPHEVRLAPAGHQPSISKSRGFFYYLFYIISHQQISLLKTFQNLTRNYLKKDFRHQFPLFNKLTQTPTPFTAKICLAWLKFFVDAPQYIQLCDC